MRNQVQLIGRLGANPTVKVLDNETKLATFSIAVTTAFKKRSGEKVSNVQWYTVSAWNSLAEAAEKFLHKGTQVNISGKLNIRTFINRAGMKYTVTEIVANNLFVPQTELSLTEVA